MQVVGVEPEEIIPLLDAIGGKGVYVMARYESQKQAEDIAAKVEQFR